MKFLLDQNLSPSLVGRLASCFPGSVHAQSVGLDRASDLQLWEFAKAHGLVIVTKDDDFNDLSVVRGSPPKVVWLQLGNCTTAQVAAALLGRSADLVDFEKDQRLHTFVIR